MNEDGFCECNGCGFSGMRSNYYTIIGVTDDNGMTRFMEVNDEEGWD